MLENISAIEERHSRKSRTRRKKERLRKPEKEELLVRKKTNYLLLERTQREKKNF